jgi:Methyltransferase domain
VNLKFEVDKNMQQDWSYQPNRFDYIHGRMGSSLVADPDHLCRQAWRCLQPGGIFEIQDLVFIPKCEDNSWEQPSTPWSSYFVKAGFTGIQTQRFSASKLSLKTLKGGLQGVSLERAMTHAEVECSLMTVGQGMQDPEIRGCFAM